MNFFKKLIFLAFFLLILFSGLSYFQKNVYATVDDPGNTPAPTVNQNAPQFSIRLFIDNGKDGKETTYDHCYPLTNSNPNPPSGVHEPYKVKLNGGVLQTATSYSQCNIYTTRQDSNANSNIIKVLIPPDYKSTGYNIVTYTSAADLSKSGTPVLRSIAAGNYMYTDTISGTNNKIVNVGLTYVGTNQAPIPKVPVNITAGSTCANDTQTKIKISWDEVPGATTGYDVSYKKSDGTTFPIGSPASGNTWWVISSPFGITYYYQVRAKNATGASAWSSIGNITSKTANECAPPPPVAKCDSATLKNPSHNGSVYNFTLTTNCGAGQSFALSVKNTSWGISPKNISTGANGDVTFDATITSPANAQSGTHQLTIIASGPNDKPKDNVIVSYVIKASNPNSPTCHQKPTLSTADPNKSAKAGNAATFSLNLKNNNSSCAPDYNLTAQGAPNNNWAVVIKNNAGTKIDKLNNVDTAKDFKVIVTSPKKADNGTLANITVTAKDAQAPSILDQVVLNVTVGTGGSNPPGDQPPGDQPPGDQPPGDNPPGNQCTVDPNSCPSGQICNPDTLVCEAPPADNPPGDEPIGSNQTFNFVIGLDEIGQTGDSVNAGTVTTNKNPAHKIRSMTVDFYNSTSSQPVKSFEVNIGYDTASGKFKGSIPLDGSFADGDYSMKITVAGYLVKKITGVHVAGNTTQTFTANLVTGDINGDNHLTIQDYSILLSCSIFAKTEEDTNLCNSDDSYLPLSNLNDDTQDGDPLIDQLDYNYFIREFRNHPDGD